VTDTNFADKMGMNQVSSLLSAARLLAGTHSAIRRTPTSPSASIRRTEQTQATDTRAKAADHTHKADPPVATDTVTISEKAQELQAKAEAQQVEKEITAEGTEQATTTTSKNAPEESDGSRTDRKTQAQVAKLKSTDRAVRSHEQAHISAAGGYAKGGASFSYTRGPDGKLYAVAGEVGIDVSPVAGDPDATMRKAQVVRQAAMAPANPSGQDRAVAAAASQMAQEARTDKVKQTGDENTGNATSTSRSQTESTSNTRDATPSSGVAKPVGGPSQSTYPPSGSGSISFQPVVTLLDLLA
jgi:hypothetical protein